MKKTLLLFFYTLIPISINAQLIQEVDDETFKKDSIEIRRKLYAGEIKTKVDAGATIKDEPNLTTLFVFKKDTEIIILDHNSGHFEVKTDSLRGYIQSFYIQMTPEIDKLIDVMSGERERMKRAEKAAKKKADEEEKERIEKEIVEKINKNKIALIEQKHINKYGVKVYKKLKAGYIWLGMTKDMALISLGRPNDINRTVGSWGVHEQWVYGSSYYYFENGKLTSYQD